MSPPPSGYRKPRFAVLCLGCMVLLACDPSAPYPAADAGDSLGGQCPNDLPSTCNADAPGYIGTIAPLLASRCLECHGPGGQADNQPLSTWAQVHARRALVLAQVQGCLMPPGAATPLTADERLALQQWLVCQAPNN